MIITLTLPREIHIVHDYNSRFLKVYSLHSPGRKKCFPANVAYTLVCVSIIETSIEIQDYVALDLTFLLFVHHTTGLDTDN